MANRSYIRQCGGAICGSMDDTHAGLHI